LAGLLEGQVALITGGSAGIGRAAVELFAREGAHVVFAARGAQRGQEVTDTLKAGGHEVAFLQADVSRSEEVQRLVSKTVESFGRIDCALNNAAAVNSIRRLADFDETEFDAEATSNLKSIWLCMKHEIEQMKKQQPPGGAVVNVSSINGLGGARGGSLYSMSKAGIIALTKSAAQEYAADHIRVNALVPGAFDTEMLRTAVTLSVGDDQTKIEEAFKRYTDQIPLRRIGNPVEAAQAALWLCSNASSYVTGHSLIVDGGLTSWAR